MEQDKRAAFLDIVVTYVIILVTIWRNLMRMKLRRVGNSLGTSWPKEILARMNVKEGDELFLVTTQDGVLVTPYDPKFERTMSAMKRIMARDREGLKELSRR